MISVAIPFYNTHEFLEKCLENLLDYKFVNEIIIVDDCSKKEIFYNHKKVKIIRNRQNIGAFKNKYNAIKNSTNRWVYLLDSDNSIPLNSLKSLENINTQKLDADTIYCPSSLILKNVDLDEKLDDSVVDFSFIKKKIDISIAKEYLVNKNNTFHWLLNTGNFLVNKNNYISVVDDVLINKKYKYLEADAIVFTYFWLKNKKYLKILKNFHIFHTLRQNSISHTVGDKNYKSINYYTDLIINNN
jgi:glycosyltransferase involved in cell wall biosynthesis